MPPITINSSTGSYDVFVAEGNFAESMSRVDDAHILADEFFRTHFHNSPANPIFIEASEQAKSLDRMPTVIEQLRAAGVNRTHRLVAIGGGVIQDIASFVASVYMRGLQWDYFPTTVLAMVDSCIGGKSSINVGPYKNLVGTFHPPQRIFIDPALAQTLPADQFASGLIEAAKITFVRGPESFDEHLACMPSTTMPTERLEELILNSLLAKKHFIEIDEFDKKERLLLNFGHTFGHSIEGASHYAIPHGIAVGLGIQCSIWFQRDRGVILDDPRMLPDFEEHLDELIRTLPDLRERLQAIDLDDVMERFASDKKHTTGRYTLILIAASGAVVLEQIVRTAELEARIRHAFAMTIGTYSR